MNNTKVKICGLTRLVDIESVNEIKPDYVGFVFANKSKRYISPDKAYELKQELDNSIEVVGVFVDDDIDNIVSIVNRGIIDVVQLHGNESNEYIQQLMQLIDCKVIKAYCIENKEDILEVNNSMADMILLDSGRGSGKTFDWQLLELIDRPYIVAGGLDMDNVIDVINRYYPYGVDASSLLESEGLKDRDKMARFVEVVRKGKE